MISQLTGKKYLDVGQIAGILHILYCGNTLREFLIPENLKSL